MSHFVIEQNHSLFDFKEYYNTNKFKNINGKLNN